MARASRARPAAAGFTLVELLVVISLLSLVMLAMGSALVVFERRERCLGGIDQCLRMRQARVLRVQFVPLALGGTELLH
uniref:prepilin-type N-terminal cleavage/methylation domain-containing protein n=1 Tax=Raoultella sp. 18097 TaxID=2681429 RepID=UPI00190FA63C